ncbi:biotin/lipoyl-containing protein [Candidatus Phytoplasma palmae]|uniref:biotin/lipoyl-containing protein n=1 Tax=Candidatus Phytoplasma palmae TaxID=85624 RepID=UPI00399055DD
MKIEELRFTEEEGTIINCNFKVGDKVQEGEIIFVIETDKINAEITSPKTGVVKQLFFKEQDIVKSGDLLALIE